MKTYIQKCKEGIIQVNEKSFDDLKIILDEKLNKFFLENGEFYTIREVLNDIMSLS